MRQRQAVLGLGTAARADGLIYPILFADGDYFPDDAKKVQHKDLKRFTCPAPAFRETTAFVEFFREMQEVANQLTRQVMRAPQWCDGWPVVTPPPVAAPVISLPRI
jgi:hypothetical protein